jgi:hypothetical protein
MASSCVQKNGVRNAEAKLLVHCALLVMVTAYSLAQHDGMQTEQIVEHCA